MRYCFIYIRLTKVKRSSLVPQLVTNLPAVQETQVRSQGWQDHWRREWQATPVFLPGEFHGQRSLVSYSLWGTKSCRQMKWLSMQHMPKECSTNDPQEWLLFLLNLWGNVGLLQPEVHYCGLQINILLVACQWFLTISDYGFVIHKYLRKNEI
jgi:hypothetical protein